MGNYKIGVMLGDGIGPEIVKVTVNVLEAIGRLTGLKLQLEYFPVGLAAYENMVQRYQHKLSIKRTN